MSDLTKGFIAPPRRPVALRGMARSDDDAVLAKAAQLLQPATLANAPPPWFTGTVTHTYRDGLVVGITVSRVGR